MMIVAGGGLSASDAASEPGIPVLPNIDDDNGNSRSDWRDFSDRQGTGVDWEDDLYPVDIPSTVWERLPRRHSLQLRLEGDVEQARIWRDGLAILGDLGGDAAITDVLLTERDVAVGLSLEVETAHTAVALRLRQLDAKGEDVRSTFVRAYGAPMFLHHHLQPAEHVWVVELDDGGWSNRSMVEVYDDVLGSRFTAIDGPQFDWDPWIQDEIEFASETTPLHRRDVVIDSIRDRGLDDFAEEELLGEGFDIRVWGEGMANSLDSFGNLEASPPVVVDGRSHPYGRLYWGGDSGYHPAAELTDALRAQGVQEPFVTDTSWLTVGHVDEFVSFLPDPQSPKGFRMLLADVSAAWAILEAMDPETALPRYEDHNHSTVGDLLGNAALRAHNEDVQRDSVDPVREQFVAELGLSDDDILLVPALWEELPPEWGGGSAALIPGMVNLVVVQDPDDGGSDVFLADPFVRSDDDDQDSDPVIAAMRAQVPEGIRLHFVDDWQVYHLGLGEVHCGTNTTRTPTPGWWADSNLEIRP